MLNLQGSKIIFLKFLKLVNLYYIVWNLHKFWNRYPIRIKKILGNNIYLRDKNLKIEWRVNKMRLNLYSEGLEVRGNKLAESYFINKISFKPNDVIIDIGANSGDLKIYLQSKNLNLIYFGIEPSPSDFDNLNFNKTKNMNCFEKKLAFSDKNGELNFYLDIEDANSSLIEPKFFTDTIVVSAMTLDEFYKVENLTEIKLIKLEAEGGEPEILNSGQLCLSNTRYLAIDTGPERGILEESTWASCFQTLREIDFELIYGPTKISNNNVMHNNRSLFRNINFN